MYRGGRVTDLGFTPKQKKVKDIIQNSVQSHEVKYMYKNYTLTRRHNKGEVNVA